MGFGFGGWEGFFEVMRRLYFEGKGVVLGAGSVFKVGRVVRLGLVRGRGI